MVYIIVSDPKFLYSKLVHLILNLFQLLNGCLQNKWKMMPLIRGYWIILVEMSCLLSAREDKSVKLTPDCRRMLDDRVTMWEYAAKVWIF